MVANSEKIRPTLLAFLKSSPIPLTATELCSRLRVKAVKLAEYEVLRELRPLREEGLVRLERGRWSAVSRVAVASSLDSVPVKLDESDALRTPSVPASPVSATATIEWSPIKSPILNSTPRFDKQPTPATKPPDFSGPWSTFRKLLGYYADCVRNDEGCEASGFLQDCGERFIFLSLLGTWYPKAAQPWRLSLPSGPHLQSLIRKLTLAGQDGVLVLGYPFQVFTRPEGEGAEGVFVKPIFTYQLAWHVRVDGLEIWSDDSWAEVNLDWLTYALKKPDQQRMFLSACGLMDRGRSDESFGDGSRLSYAPDLRTLAAGVTTFFGERTREPLRPENVSSVPLPTRPESGIYNRAILMIGNRTRYTRTLLKELGRIASCSDEDLDKTALRFLFKAQDSTQTQGNPGQDQTAYSHVHEGIVIETCPLNAEQREAVASLLTENVTVITGPPGTGKSHVVGAAMANARLRDMPVLFASRNHKAIDAVVDRLAVDGQQPLIVRANSKEDAFLRFGFEDALTQLLRNEHDENATDRWIAARNELTGLLNKRGELGDQARQVENLRDRLGAVEEHMAALSATWSPEAQLELVKAPELFPGKALIELDSMIGRLRQVERIPGFLTRGGWWLKDLSQRARTRSLQQALKKNFPSWELELKGVGFRRLQRVAQRLPLLLQAAEFCTRRQSAQPLEGELRGLPAIEELGPQIQELSKRLEGLAPQALAMHLTRWTGLSREANREELASLRSALRGLDQPVSETADREAVQAALEKSLPLLLRHFPLWAVTNLAVGSRFPLLPGLFELAILDEASQCDIPSAIPIMFRAKRVGVGGDPHQLSHTTKLSQTRDALLRKRYGLVELQEQRFSYPDTSLYDLFAQTNNINPLFLKETYRSVESIADYSNQHFYGGRLRVATMAERLRIPKGIKPGIHWTEVLSPIKSGGPSGCVAPEEVEVVVKLVRELLMENQFEGTIGVVTPFRQQANRLNDRLYQEIPPATRRSCHLVVDTAHGFQGDERDVMVLSLCAGPDMPPGSRGFLRETANLMNVAVSRARAVLHVVGNRSWAAQSGIPHIERLATPSQRPSQQESPFRSPWYPHESPWERNLYNALRGCLKRLH